MPPRLSPEAIHLIREQTDYSPEKIKSILKNGDQEGISQIQRALHKRDEFDNINVQDMSNQIRQATENKRKEEQDRFNQNPPLQNNPPLHKSNIEKEVYKEKHLKDWKDYANYYGGQLGQSVTPDDFNRDRNSVQSEIESRYAQGLKEDQKKRQEDFRNNPPLQKPLQEKIPSSIQEKQSLQPSYLYTNPDFIPKEMDEGMIPEWENLSRFEAQNIANKISKQPYEIYNQDRIPDITKKLSGNKKEFKKNIDLENRKKELEKFKGKYNLLNEIPEEDLKLNKKINPVTNQPESYQTRKYNKYMAGSKAREQELIDTMKDFASETFGKIQGTHQKPGVRSHSGIASLQAGALKNIHSRLAKNLAAFKEETAEKGRHYASESKKGKLAQMRANLQDKLLQRNQSLDVMKQFRDLKGEEKDFADFYASRKNQFLEKRQLEEQKKLDQTHADFVEKKNYPETRLNLMLQTLRGLPPSQLSAAYHHYPVKTNDLTTAGDITTAISRMLAGNKKRGGLVNRYAEGDSIQSPNDSYLDTKFVSSLNQQRYGKGGSIINDPLLGEAISNADLNKISPLKSLHNVMDKRLTNLESPLPMKEGDNILKGASLGKDYALRDKIQKKAEDFENMSSDNRNMIEKLMDAIAIGMKNSGDRRFASGAQSVLDISAAKQASHTADTAKRLAALKEHQALAKEEREARQHNRLYDITSAHHRATEAHQKALLEKERIPNVHIGADGQPYIVDIDPKTGELSAKVIPGATSKISPDEIQFDKDLQKEAMKDKGWWSGTIFGGNAGVEKAKLGLKFRSMGLSPKETIEAIESGLSPKDFNKKNQGLKNKEASSDSLYHSYMSMRPRKTG